jgi:predicted RNA-binding Zn-ribbon protein involved in translation (DUF1610 family)
MRDALDPIHRACDFYVPPEENSTLDIVALNQSLHGDRVWARWPEYLVAFASNGCGDYFAYDLRLSPARVVYIGGERPPEEHLQEPENIAGQTFEEWYAEKIAHLVCPLCENTEIHIEHSENRAMLLCVCPLCGFRAPLQAVDP